MIRIKTTIITIKTITQKHNNNKPWAWDLWEAMYMHLRRTHVDGASGLRADCDVGGATASAHSAAAAVEEHQLDLGVKGVVGASSDSTMG
jgi:hypothetical protein